MCIRDGLSAYREQGIMYKGLVVRITPWDMICLLFISVGVSGWLVDIFFSAFLVIQYMHG